MAGIDDLLDQLPLDQIAAQLGVDQGTAESATRAALPALVQGMQANARDQERAASLVRAIAKHAQSPAQPDQLDTVDTADGEKIVNHVFGDSTDAVANQLGGLGGGSDLIKKLLPMLAPLLMGFLAKQFGDGGGTASSGEASSDVDSADDGESSEGGGIGDLLKGSLGGLFGKKSESNDSEDDGGGLGDLLGGGGGGGGGGLGDLLGGLLGGSGGSGGSGGGLGDLLGGLLGGGSR